MRSKTDVRNEVRKMVDDKVSRGIVVRVEWLTTEILSRKSDVHGLDADFYIACGVDFIADAVKRCVGAYTPKPEAPNAQIVMPGFDYMQKAYSFERDGETVLVPVDQLTDDEIEARAKELDAMAKGCIAHAKELRAYRRNRITAA